MAVHPWLPVSRVCGAEGGGGGGHRKLVGIDGWGGHRKAVGVAVGRTGTGKGKPCLRRVAIHEGAGEKTTYAAVLASG